MYTSYPLYKVVLRRIVALLLGILAFPTILFPRLRRRCYSYLHRLWMKTSNKPVWLEQSEKTVPGDELY
ncbi:hypothetical protein VST7929_01763 [Vibrio stylophorae]|uniref:DUF2517 domain-containing protein n=1 Tax=Vibrio stylophorae TaxID=659351 RepID=A0ABN8DRZ2_9VIBR|nr:DUF2517 family protein [Vibrio stylophorae]CAH0533886.1 hypothetical protein VST7929_01763 [Vibrio stylophorae]